MGQLINQSFYGVTGEPYTSYANDYQNGHLTEQTFLEIQDQPYSSYDYFYDASGHLASQTTNFNDGAHAMHGFENGVALTSIDDDKMTGGGSGETFVFNQGYGRDTVTDLYAHLSGAGHDTVSVATSDFADFAALLANTQTVGGNAVLSGRTDGDQITLLGMTESTVAANQSDFTFHARTPTVTRSRVTMTLSSIPKLRAAFRSRQTEKSFTFERPSL